MNHTGPTHDVSRVGRANDVRRRWVARHGEAMANALLAGLVAMSLYLSVQLWLTPAGAGVVAESTDRAAVGPALDRASSPDAVPEVWHRPARIVAVYASAGDAAPTDGAGATPTEDAGRSGASAAVRAWLWTPALPDFQHQAAAIDAWLDGALAAASAPRPADEAEIEALSRGPAIFAYWYGGRPLSGRALGLGQDALLSAVAIAGADGALYVRATAARPEAPDRVADAWWRVSAGAGAPDVFPPEPDRAQTPEATGPIPAEAVAPGVFAPRLTAWPVLALEPALPEQVVLEATFPDRGVVRRVRERSGATILTDGQRGLRVDPSGWLTMLDARQTDSVQDLGPDWEPLSWKWAASALEGLGLVPANWLPMPWPAALPAGGGRLDTGDPTERTLAQLVRGLPLVLVSDANNAGAGRAGAPQVSGGLLGSAVVRLDRFGAVAGAALPVAPARWSPGAAAVVSARAAVSAALAAEEARAASSGEAAGQRVAGRAEGRGAGTGGRVADVFLFYAVSGPAGQSRLARAEPAWAVRIGESVWLIDRAGRVLAPALRWSGEGVGR